MARNTNYLLELDVQKLFEEQNIEEIIQIETSLDAEIERKRNELRSMVGDRYKDILAASDAIKSMKCISEDIVNNIERITNTCQALLGGALPSETVSSASIQKSKLEDRTLAIQIRLAFFINERIWTCLDADNNLEAAQFYLLAQHIHTGISLTRQELLQKIPLVKQIRSNLMVLRSRIFQCISDKLQSVEITAEETSSNLNALILLQNQSSNELLRVFIEHRKSALNTVINKPHSNVRLQISAMVRCLITTVHLIHDCFMNNSGNKKGLIWHQLDEIIGQSAPTTLAKLNLPNTPLSTYIPDIILQFKPKCVTEFQALNNSKGLLDEWWTVTKECVETGLGTSLQLVTSVKGLHLIREEALKIELPTDWEKICRESNLPDKFDVWYHFLQNLITVRARILISEKIVTNVEAVQSYIRVKLEECVKSDQNEADLRWYTWRENILDVSKTTNQHVGLAMKTKGFSPNVVDLCAKMDGTYYELLEDVWQYLYGKEYNTQSKIVTNLMDFKFKRKFLDKEELESHLRMECTKESSKLSIFILNLLDASESAETHITKSIFLARFLSASLQLCTNFNNCCSFNDTTDDWIKICDNFSKTSCILLDNWIEKCVRITATEIGSLVSLKESQNMLNVLTKWDCIEIQEQTEEKVFKSQIKVPLKPSQTLTSVLIKLNRDLSEILPQTLPKVAHVKFIERNVNTILDQYKILSEHELNQIQALSCLFDVKFLTTFCIQRENVQLVNYSQEICDKFRSKIDPFDLDVFYSYLQSNVKRAVCQSQMILGCLLPSSNQLSSLGEKIKEQDKEPSILALSVPSSSAWFPLLPITRPTHKVTSTTKESKSSTAIRNTKGISKKSQESAATVRSSAASLFGNLTTDWFS